MAAIQSLLNPLPESDERFLQLPSPCSTPHAKEFSPPPPSRKKQKLSKDAAVFTHGAIRGECRYPPCEYQDEVLAAHHQQYEIHPLGHIAEYPRHIPYNSEKKSFLEKTGRESFEVFQYTFKVPGDEKKYCMMWDYNIGLVRTTPLFKCGGYSKTTPAKMLNRNPGLRDICHSITGGALVAQGYWMPFAAAKAVAATFCWNIRYALTPVFGAEFPSQCIRPGSDRFGEMVIDCSITRCCTEEARAYRSLEKLASSRATSTIRSPLTPDSPTSPRHLKQLRPNGLKLAGSSSCQSIEAGSNDHYSLVPGTPRIAYRNAWTPANTPRSVVDTHLPSPREILAGIAAEGMKDDARATDSSSSASSSPLSPTSQRVYVADEDYDGGSSAESSDGDALTKALHRKCTPSPGPSDEKAAYLLMSLRMKKADLNSTVRGTKRRASTYWAFGSRCPNVDADGIDTCQYAHWDTGRLSSFYQQRGTCWHWAHPRLKCHFGPTCTFEHRETGFMGTHHGILELSGMNLQIADAARKSGFDTRHHVALLDLIWSVRRVAFNHGVTKPRLLPPPKHPVYPDRHRPGAQVNDLKSRKRLREAETEAHGTSSNPIDLDAYGSENDNKCLVPAGPKRQKTTLSLTINPTARTTTISNPNPLHPSRFPSSRLSTIKAESKEKIPFSRATSMPFVRPLNLLPPRHSQSASRCQLLALDRAHSGRQLDPFRTQTVTQVFNQRKETLGELHRVSQTLSENLDAMRQCQRAMKTLYDADDQIRHPDVFDLLIGLRNDMEDSEKANAKALSDVDRVIQFLKSGGRDSAIGMEEID